MSTFLGAIPFVFFALCALVALQFRKNEEDAADLRGALVAAAVVSSVWMVAGTEVLSLFGQIAYWPVLLWWTLPHWTNWTGSC